MIDVATKLVLELENETNEIPEKRNEIPWLKMAMEIARVKINTLNKEHVNYFQMDNNSEAAVYKKSKVMLLSKFITYHTMYKIQYNKPPGSYSENKAYYQKENKKVNNYFKKNRKHLMCLASDYFTNLANTDNTSAQEKEEVTSFYSQLEKKYTKTDTFKIAEMLAMKEVKLFLLKKSNKNKKQKSTMTKKSTLKWTAHKVALVELIYALNTEGVFNNGTATLNEITKNIQVLFNTEIGQFNRMYLEIKARKSDRTKFLSSLKTNLIDRMNNADEK